MKKEFRLGKLTFESPLHLGEREDIREGTDTFIHSDTLFSAFCHNYLLLYGKTKLESVLQKFLKDTPPFLISSAFPWWKDGFYFPIPKNQMLKGKKLKKISFVEKRGFEKLLSGESIEKIIGTFKTLPDEEGNKPWKTADVPRLCLSRLTNHPGENYFHFGEVSYGKDSGLFFLIDFKNNTFEKELKAAFNLMSDEGIGGDRSSGKGLFEKPQFEEIKFNLSDTKGAVSLSLHYPKQDELTDIRNGYYELKERKGYIYSPYGQSLRRKSLRMFSEGSVFPDGKKGQIADLTPEVFKSHKIYRYGLCFALPCELEIRK